MTDEDLIAKLKIEPKDRVLDIGGSSKQHQGINVDIMVDFYPPEKAPYWPSKLLAKKFVQLDIMREKLPFKDGEFDVCLCTHVLEDLYNPFLILEEMSRVAKRGYIATPSRGKEMVFLHFNLTDWQTGPRRQPGLSHHHWFIENVNGQLVFTPKIFPILYTSEFHITKWTGEEECQYFWKNKISYDFFSQIDTHAIIENYREFVRINSDKIAKGAVLFYLDNPLVIFRELAKACYQSLFCHS